jgi:ribose transport system permease protein
MTAGVRRFPGQRLAHALSFRRISAAYLGVVLVAVYSIWLPDTFPTTTTFKSLLVEQAVTAIAAVGLVFPLAAGAFDLSIAWTLGASAILAAWLMGIQGASAGAAIVAALAAGLAIGAVNGLLVVRFSIEPIIATLGVGSCLAAFISWLSGGQPIVGLSETFQEVATRELGGIAYPVFYLLVLALAAWYVLEHTPIGRRLYATGGGREAARLAGVRTGRFVAGSFVAAALLAAVAGVIATARVGAGSPDTGPGYLLPVFAAAFLGATQFTPGQFNVRGTVLAVYVLAVGVKGLELGGAPYWLPDLFNGLALLVAVGLARAERRRGSTSTRLFALVRARRPAAPVERS